MTMTEEETAEAERAARSVEAMRTAGVNTEEAVQDDYFGFEDYRQVDLPDGKSWVQIKALNEGARRKYQNNQNREVMVERATQNMKFKMETGEERHSLLLQAICDWNLQRTNDGGKGRHNVACNEAEKRMFLDKAPPSVVDVIDREVRRQNPWLRQDMTVEDIDKQIADLTDQKADLIKEKEAGNS